MVNVWSTEENAGIKICAHCGAKYKITITRYPSKDSDSANCQKCGKLLESWNSTESPSFTLIDDEKQ